jgi:lecithin-cholesterol acyltransferase
MCDPKGYHVLSDALKSMGYIPGLTMQAAPYDFRKSIAASESQLYIKKSVDTFFKITGKKTYLFGHSLGSLHATEAVYSMPQE